MRSSMPTLAALLFILSLSTITAFPQYARQRRDVDALNPDVVTGLAGIVASLLPVSQCPSTYKVDPVKYYYQAPGPNDRRGPCPGLNALANHGYLPRNGIVSAAQIRDAARCILNFGDPLTLGLIIAGYFTTADLAIDQGSLGAPVLNPDGSPTMNVGLCRHTGIERDGSLVGTDVGLGGDCKVNLTLWDQFKQIAENATTPWSVESFADASYARWLESRQNNPTFTWQAFPFVTTSAAAAFAWFKFSEGLPALDTPSQASWWVDNKIPASFVDKGAQLGATQLAQITAQFIARHPDPQWITTVQVPSNPNCYNCWVRFMAEDTFVGFSNTLQPLYDKIAPYAQCTLLGCPRV